MTSSLSATLAALLPPDWSVEVNTPDSALPRQADAILSVVRPGHEPVMFSVDVRSTANTQTVLQLARPLDNPPMLFAPYIAAPTRARLQDAGVSYADATGWVWINEPESGLFIRSTGAATAPRSPVDATTTTTTHRIERLSGPGASKVIETLLEQPPSDNLRIGTVQLSHMARTNQSTTSRVLPTLEAAGAIERQSKSVVRIHKRTLLTLWTRDYDVLESNASVRHVLLLREDPAVVAKRLAHDHGFVLTATMAAQHHLQGQLSVAPNRRPVLYAPTEGLPATVSAVDVSPAEANLIIIKPKDDGILRNALETLDGAVVTAARTTADLMTLPGRETQVAEQLIDHLAHTDPQWRD